MRFLQTCHSSPAVVQTGWLAGISRLWNCCEIRLINAPWADGATIYWIWDAHWLPWCSSLCSRMVLTIRFSLLLGHLMVPVDFIAWEANWKLVCQFRLAFLYSFCVYRFSLSFRSATAISDVARACRSKKNCWDLFQERKGLSDQIPFEFTPFQKHLVLSRTCRVWMSMLLLMILLWSFCVVVAVIADIGV